VATKVSTNAEMAMMMTSTEWFRSERSKCSYTSGSMMCRSRPVQKGTFKATHSPSTTPMAVPIQPISTPAS